MLLIEVINLPYSLQNHIFAFDMGDLDSSLQQRVSEAFGRQAPHFDAIEEQNEILKDMRSRIRSVVQGLLHPSAKILELNSGTGLDAIWFAEHGHSVTATDGSAGMVEELTKKVCKANLQKQVEPMLLSYFELEKLSTGPYDLIFSNFGGLNCSPTLDNIFANFPRLLKPNGYVVLVMMPKICPWEIAYLLRGNKQLALRRLQKNGALSHLEGIEFTSWYFSPKEVRSAFPAGFKQVTLKGLGSLMPPPYMEKFPQKFPQVFNMLKKLDKGLQSLPPFNSWADHFILVMQNKKHG